MSKLQIYPIAVFKYKGPDDDNNSILHFFVGSTIEKIMQDHRREFFVVQRYVPSKGMSPNIIRCDLNIRRYPNLDIEKLGE